MKQNKTSCNKLFNNNNKWDGKQGIENFRLGPDLVCKKISLHSLFFGREGRDIDRN